MRQIQHYQFDARHCALFETRSRTTFVVGRGRLWITVEGEDADHWLASGDTLDVAARQRVWLGAENADTCLDVVQDPARSRAPSTVAIASAGYLRRRFANWRGNTTRRLNPGT